MKLLIITQIIDKTDSTLGFFQKWVIELSKKFDHVEVICLKEGVHDLSPNVMVSSLGKEKGESRIKYIKNFYKYIWEKRDNYDAVFVHMNQEYIILGGIFWKLLGKKIYMWRNHYDGSFLTDIAAWFCDKVFCTSKFSYTAKYKKTVIMPVGVDEDSARLDEKIDRIPRSIIFLGRLDESKRPDILIEALGKMHQKNIDFKASFVGGNSKSDSTYTEGLYAQVEKLGLKEKINFTGSVPNTETFRYYRSHDIFVNCSKSGMFDKTIFKAIACGCLVLATSLDFQDLVGDDFIFEYNNSSALSEKIEEFLNVSPDQKSILLKKLNSCIKDNSLKVLVERLEDEIK